MENTNLNLNPSRPDKFKFVLSDIPSLSYINEATPDEFEQNIEKGEGYNNFLLSIMSVDLPGIVHNEEKVGTMFSSVSTNTMNVDFEVLTTDLKLDADFYIYKLLFAWMRLIKNPYGFNYANINETETKMFVDGSVIINDIMDNKGIMQYDFVDLRPIILPPLPLNYQDDTELRLNVTWAYTAFNIRNSRGEDLLLNSEM